MSNITSYSPSTFKVNNVLYIGDNARWVVIDRGIALELRDPDTGIWTRQEEDTAT